MSEISVQQQIEMITKNLLVISENLQKKHISIGNLQDAVLRIEGRLKTLEAVVDQIVAIRSRI